MDLQGNPTVPKDLFHINLGQVKEVVGRLGGFLDAADAQIGAYLEYKWDAEEEGRAIEAETRAEMRAEYGSG